jgi:hypothetical protein
LFIEALNDRTGPASSGLICFVGSSLRCIVTDCIGMRLLLMAFAWHGTSYSNKDAAQAAAEESLCAGKRRKGCGI